ncbi:acetylornithine deacetylase ArgE [Beggiatoa alba B18LD]|uniref:Acetylornithine deacetylase ArgE n=1 Tax=Beggiatoa alba B18LD TaxID=395493 RepID=I3CBP5_9GAMM|nr:acetylornithine deacetylase [Beggiatoa alba]EIJ41038.1 acetylornithine deacetylase ArgE [Beggiatoa alba B18LD]
MSFKLPSLFSLTHQLIALPSVSSASPQFDQSNRAVIELLADWCTHLGFRCEVLPVNPAQEKYNLVATFGTGAGGLVLAGHTDTVPFDLGRWQTDPFQLQEKDNRWYGLGTSDMKAFFALALQAVEELAIKQLKQPLILLATADEESTMAGARALAKLGYPKARYALIGEPTGLRPVRLHKGIFMEAIRLVGASGHSSNPALGNNALEGMYRVLSELLRWRESLQATYQNAHFLVPVPTLNLGHIHGGDNPNRICAECELHIDLRPLPMMKIEELRAELHARVRAVLADSGLQVSFRALFEGIEAMETPATAEIVRLTEQLTQHSAVGVAFGTEAPYLQQLGMETIILGAGDIEQAHQPDEYLGIERIQPMLRILKQMIQHFCL